MNSAPARRRISQFSCVFIKYFAVLPHFGNLLQLQRKRQEKRAAKKQLYKLYYDIFTVFVENWVENVNNLPLKAIFYLIFSNCLELFNNLLHIRCVLSPLPQMKISAVF